MFSLVTSLKYVLLFDDGQERSEMDIKSDIRRLNGTAAFLNSLPQEPAALALTDRQMVCKKKIDNLKTL